MTQARAKGVAEGAHCGSAMNSLSELAQLAL